MAFARPYVLSGLAFLTGYLAAVMRRLPRVADEPTVRYLRQQQMRRLRALGDLSEIRSMFGGGES